MTASPGTISYTSNAVATSYTFSGATSGNVNTAVVYTLTPNANYTGTITITPTGAASTGLTAQTATFSNSSSPLTVSFTPTVTGSITFTATSSGGLTASPSSVITYTSIDLTPPVRSSGSPSGAQASGTTSINMTLVTNESATCRYSTVSGTLYASMTDTFGTTGGTSQATTISGLSDGNSYTYYVRCNDLSSNANTDDYTISFSIATPVVFSGGGGGGGNAHPVLAPVNIPTPPTSSQGSSTTSTSGSSSSSSNSGSIKTYNFGTTTLSTAIGTKKTNPVKELQRFLNDTYNAKLPLTGVFGTETKAVVKKWQKAHGLKADGVVGAKTKVVMRGSLGKKK